MPTILDWVLETHPGPEPRVLVDDVQRVLEAVVRPTNANGEQIEGESVTLIAEKAGVSTRTVYRVLKPDPSKDTISLELADSLCVAANSHLKHCRLKWPDGTVTPYSALSERDS
jgi:hypothetical protein